MSLAALSRNEVTRQTRRAVDLLNFVLSVLNEEKATNDNHLGEITEQVEGARAQLLTVVDRDDRDFYETITSCNDRLNDALRLASRAHELPMRQAQSLHTLEQTLALLKPIANLSKNDVETTKLKVIKPNGDRPVTESQKPVGIERRKHKRVPMETDVNFQGLSNFYTGFAEDISCGGLFVTSYCLQPIGTHVDLSFTLPNGYVVNTPGQVRWLRDIRDPDDDTAPGMGVMFEDLKSEDKKQIEAFIQERSPLFYDDDV
jgi:uncharacterized protein (TIGR02266 family)